MKNKRHPNEILLELMDMDLSEQKYIYDELLDIIHLTEKREKARQAFDEIYKYINDRNNTR